MESVRCVDDDQVDQLQHRVVRGERSLILMIRDIRCVLTVMGLIPEISINTFLDILSSSLCVAAPQIIGDTQRTPKYIIKIRGVNLNLRWLPIDADISHRMPPAVEVIRNGKSKGRLTLRIKHGKRYNVDAVRNIIRQAESVLNGIFRRWGGVFIQSVLEV